MGAQEQQAVYTNSKFVQMNASPIFRIKQPAAAVSATF